MAFKDQPAYVTAVRAKPGKGDRLFELATVGMEKSGSSDRFLMLREDADPDVLWNIEVFRSVEAKDAPPRTATWRTSFATRSSAFSRNPRSASKRTPTQLSPPCRETSE